MQRTPADDAARRSSLLDAVLSRSADAVVELDVGGIIRAWNPAAARTFGVAENAVCGRPFGEFVDADHVPQWQEALDRSSAGAPATVAAVVLRRADGLAVHASLALSPMLDASAAVVGCCAVVQDHSERRLAQETLAAGEERVRRGEALAGVGSFVLDGIDQSVQWSEGMFQIFGNSPADFDGSLDAHLALVHDEDRRKVAAALEQPLREGRSTELDHRAVVGDRTLWVFLAAEPVLDEAGRVMGVRGVCQDITARKDAEASVLSALALAERANAELRELDALKDEFLATVSHELRTPLTSIIGFAGLLMKTSPELSTYVGPIARNGADMARMVENLLDYSRLQAGQVALHPASLDLAGEVDRHLEAHANRAAGQRLLNDVPVGLRVVTDPNALERVLGNLIGNASRYAGEGRTVRVQATRQEDGSTVIAVADDGPGIAVEHQQHLFERFFQVPGAGSRRGTGIGLAIVREYVTRQGGNVWCESREGEGATFFVRLPASAPPDTA